MSHIFNTKLISPQNKDSSEGLKKIIKSTLLIFKNLLKEWYTLNLIKNLEKKLNLKR